MTPLDTSFLSPLQIPPDRIAHTPFDWYQSHNMDYETAVQFMIDRASAIRTDNARECVWFVEHPPLYTGGTSATESDLISPKLPVYKTGRGGQYTYHGTGQRTLYVMVDLQNRNLGIREYVRCLEQWIIDTLAEFDIVGVRRCDRVGIWVDMGNGYEDKICAIGVRVKKWVSFHGVALNINPNLDYYNHIVPCGIREKKCGVTSFKKLGKSIDSIHIDTVLAQKFLEIFNTDTNL